jgi:hypothetical protein
MRRLRRPNIRLGLQAITHWMAPFLAGALMTSALAALAGCAPGTGSPFRPPAELAPVDVVVATVRAPTRSEIAALVPYTVRMPGWVPEGYELQPEVGYAMGEAALLLEWRHEAGSAIDLVVGPSAPRLPQAPSQFRRQIDLNGHPALLFYGMSDSSEDGWDPEFHLMLTWQVDEVHYTLAASGRGASRKALVAMAESFS